MTMERRMSARKIVAEAAGKPGMTVDEMADLVQRAMKLGATGQETIEVTTRGIGTVRIKTARVTVEAEAQAVSDG
jgi:hypothetical protein